MLDDQAATFTTEFKCEAGSLVLDQGYSCPEAAKSIDVSETALRRWGAQLQLGKKGTDLLN